MRKHSTNHWNVELFPLEFQNIAAQQLKQILENQLTGQRVVNDELVDLRTQIALFQSSNDVEPQ